MILEKGTRAYEVYHRGEEAALLGKSQKDNPFVLGGKYIHFFNWWWKGFTDGANRKII